MSKRPPIAEIINAAQHALLDLMREALGPMGRRELRDATRFCDSTIGRHLQDLAESGLVEVTQAGHLMDTSDDKRRHRGAYLYSITRSGSRALARYKRRMDDADKVVVPPGRDNIFSRPVYVPEQRAFYRNGGNMHIKSRGFAC